VTEVLRVLLPPSRLQLLPDQDQQQVITFVTAPREDVWVSVQPRQEAEVETTAKEGATAATGAE